MRSLAGGCVRFGELGSTSLRLVARRGRLRSGNRGSSAPVARRSRRPRCPTGRKERSLFSFSGFRAPSPLSASGVLFCSGDSPPATDAWLEGGAPLSVLLSLLFLLLRGILQVAAQWAVCRRHEDFLLLRSKLGSLLRCLYKCSGSFPIRSLRRGVLRCPAFQLGV